MADLVQALRELSATWADQQQELMARMQAMQNEQLQALLQRQDQQQ